MSPIPEPGSPTHPDSYAMLTIIMTNSDRQGYPLTGALKTSASMEYGVFVSVGRHGW